MNQNSSPTNQNENVSTIAARRAELEAQLAAIAAEEARLRETMLAEMQAKVDTLPTVLGVNNLDEVVAIIRQRQKGTLGKLDTAANDAVRSRTVLTPEQKAKVVEEFKMGGPENQRSKIIERYRISASTLQNILKDAGLVQSRAE